MPCSGAARKAKFIRKKGFLILTTDRSSVPKETIFWYSHSPVSHKLLPHPEHEKCNINGLKFLIPSSPTAQGWQNWCTSARLQWGGELLGLSAFTAKLHWFRDEPVLPPYVLQLCTHLDGAPLWHLPQVGLSLLAGKLFCLWSSYPSLTSHCTSPLSWQPSLLTLLSCLKCKAKCFKSPTASLLHREHIPAAQGSWRASSKLLSQRKGSGWKGARTLVTSSHRELKGVP